MWPIRSVRLDRVPARGALADLDGSGVTRIDFHAPNLLVVEYEIQPEQPAELELFRQEISDRHESRVHSFRYRPHADGTGVLKPMRSQPGFANKLSCNSIQNGRVVECRERCGARD